MRRAARCIAQIEHAPVTPVHLACSICSVVLDCVPLPSIVFHRTRWILYEQQKKHAPTQSKALVGNSLFIFSRWRILDVL